MKKKYIFAIIFLSLSHAVCSNTFFDKVRSLPERFKGQGMQRFEIVTFKDFTIYSQENPVQVKCALAVYVYPEENKVYVENLYGLKLQKLASNFTVNCANLEKPA